MKKLEDLDMKEATAKKTRCKTRGKSKVVARMETRSNPKQPFPSGSTKARGRGGRGIYAPMFLAEGEHFGGWLSKIVSLLRGCWLAMEAKSRMVNV